MPGAWSRRVRGVLRGGAADAGDAGVTLVEVLVASGLIGVVMTAMTSFFVSSVSVTSRQSGAQAAIQLADDATDRVRALKGSALATGRDLTSVNNQWGSPVAGVAAYLADTQKTWDASAVYPAGTSAPLPTTPRVATVNGIAYGQNWYVGKCWQPLAGGDCGPTQTSGYVEFFRVVVAVTWPEQHCTGALCSYVTSTLVSSASSDPVFVGGQTAQPPRVNNPGDQSGEVSVPELLQLTATGGAPPLLWSAGGTLPPGLSITSSGLISGSPTTAGSYTATVTVTDGFGLTGSATFAWNIVALPQLTNPGSQSSVTGAAVSLPIAASGGTTPYAWSVATPDAWGATGLPPGLSIDPATGVISGTPTAAGTGGVTVTVTDALGQSASTTFTWTVIATYRGLVVADGPRGYWRLGESSGLTAVDDMGASNGTYAGGYTQSFPGALVNDSNTAVDFLGASGRVSVPSVAALNLTSQVTIEAWVKPDTLNGTQYIVNKGTFYFLYIKDGVTYFGINSGGTYLYVTTTQVTAGAWQHLVGTYDGSRLVLYRNGAVVAQAAASGAISSTAAAVFIGAFDATGSYFNGGIDEVAIYGSALTSTQTLAHYQRGNGTRPDVTITFPAGGGAYSNATWNAGCSSGICGTAASTGGGLASVSVSVRQGAGNYWNGTAFSSATEVLLAATGTTNWTRAFAATNFPAEGSYTVRAVGTDSSGNTGTASISFTIDRTAPTVAVSFPASGSTYGPSTWNAGCSSGICGTAADSGGGVASVSVSVRQGAGNYWNGTSFSSATEVLLPATGTTSWTLAFPGANFPATGSYTVRAVATDAAGNTASASSSLTIDRTAPTVSALTLFNANGAVTASTDEVRITFSELLNTATICSAWSGTGNQSLTGNGVVVVTITENGTNDTLTVTSSACTLHIGTFATGRDYVSVTSVFSGNGGNASTLTWTAATRLLTIHLGAKASGTLRSGQAAGTVTYTPDTAITDAYGNAIASTPLSFSGQRF